MINHDDNAVCKTRNQKARQYRRLYVACFIIFLVMATVERLLPKAWRYQAAVEKDSSIIEQAKEQAGTFVPYLFMNY
jgi:hypothetical protein